MAKTDRAYRISWRKDSRTYSAELSQDLFGWYIVRRSWGAVGTPKGKSLVTAYPSWDEAIEVVQSVAKRREQRGYAPLS